MVKNQINHRVEFAKQKAAGRVQQSPTVSSKRPVRPARTITPRRVSSTGGAKPTLAELLGIAVPVITTPRRVSNVPETVKITAPPRPAALSLPEPAARPLFEQDEPVLDTRLETPETLPSIAPKKNARKDESKRPLI